MSAVARSLLAPILSILALSGVAAGDPGAAPQGASPPPGAPAAAPAPAPYALSPTSPVADEPVPLPRNLQEGWYAWIDTSMGTIVARLLPEQAPQSVAHFAALADGRLGWPDPVTGEPRHVPYYDGQLVSRAVASERIELGERSDAGRYTAPVYVPQEGDGPVDFSAPGRLGMIRSVGNRISGAKFVITPWTATFLTRNYPCFGMVVSGLDVVQRISEVKTTRAGKPLEPITVNKIRIRKVGNPPPLPDPVPHVPKAVQIGIRPDAPR